MTGDPYGPGEIMTTIARDVGVSKHIGSYSDAIEAPAGMRWLFTSGTPGISPETGDLPKGIEAQNEAGLGKHLYRLEEGKYVTCGHGEGEHNFNRRE
jgi:enamine deaminase RidA (YjgF/YER057c/UK114 family)